MRELKREKLSAPVRLCAGDSLTVNYTGTIHGQKVVQKELIKHTVPKGTEPKLYDEVIIFQVEGEFGLADGIGAIIGTR